MTEPSSSTDAVAGREPADERLARLIRRALPGAEIVRVTALAPDSSAGVRTNKAAGYGVPLRVELRAGGVERTLVLHTATKNPFGHDRRADRASAMLLAADSFGLLPAHVRALDVGAFSENDAVSLTATGEFYLLTEFAEGRPYAEDLRHIAAYGQSSPLDRLRVDRLVDYLVGIHAQRLEEPFAYARAARDLIGSGEGIFGIVDGYGDGTSGASSDRLRAVELSCVEWRWRLKTIERPLVRTHCDFHPFNVLFNRDSELALLDTSRGSQGDAADDVCAMAINYPFFALEEPKTWRLAFRELWLRFWNRYLERSADARLLEVAAPFLAWRGLVLANPAFYPDLGAPARARLLEFVERTLRAERFDPDFAEAMFE